MTDFLLYFLLSAAAGVLSGWGVGGGTILTVSLTLFLGMEQRQAQAINLLFFLPTAALSLLFHRKNGLIDKAAACDAAIPGTIAALLCSLAALRLDVSLLRKPFGVFLLFCGASMLLPRRGKNLQDS